MTNKTDITKYNVPSDKAKIIFNHSFELLNICKEGIAKLLFPNASIYSRLAFL